MALPDVAVYGKIHAHCGADAIGHPLRMSSRTKEKKKKKKKKERLGGSKADIVRLPRAGAFRYARARV